MPPAEAATTPAIHRSDRRGTARLNIFLRDAPGHHDPRSIVADDAGSREATIRDMNAGSTCERREEARPDGRNGLPLLCRLPHRPEHVPLFRMGDDGVLQF